MKEDYIPPQCSPVRLQAEGVIATSISEYNSPFGEKEEEL